MTTGISLDSAEIIAVTLRSFDRSKEQSIITQVGEISIYEDVDYPVVRAELTLLDAVAIISDFPVRGEERLEIKFRSRQIDTITKYEFIVYDISAIVTAGTGSSMVYTLKCASEEYISNVYRVSRTFKDVGHSIVESIFKREIKSTKSLAYDPSKGIQEITIPNLTPFAAVDFVRQRTIPSNGTSYLFFENQNGYNFRSIQDLIDNRTIQSADTLKYEYTYVPGAITLDKASDKFLNMLNVEFVSLINTTSIINGGTFASRTKIFDINNKSIDVIDTNSDALFDNTGGFKAALRDSNREFNTYMLVKDSARQDDFRTGTHALRRDNIVRFNRETVRCQVYGNNELAVGKFIKMNIPVPAVDKRDSFIQGDFLITRLRHIISNGPHPTYNVSLDCNKVQ